MSEDSSNNTNSNVATNIIIWLAGIMILVVGGVYLLGENEDKRNIKKAKCESDFFAQAARVKYGRYDSKYKSAVEKCIKNGYFMMP